SPCLSDICGEKMTAGRVQSVAVRLVVDRERVIRSHTVVHHFGVRLDFDGPQGRWYAQWRSKSMLPEGEEHFTNQAIAARVASVRQVSVFSFEDTEERRGPPAPFTTTALQEEAGVTLKFSPARTMEVAQR